MDFSILYASFGRDFSCEPASVFKRAAAIGFDAVEISVNDFLLNQNEDYIKALRNHASESGIRLTCCGGGLNGRRDITSPDTQVRKEGIAHIRRVLATAKAIGSEGLDGINYVPWNMVEGPINRQERLEMCIQSLGELLKFAEDIGIDYALEVANRYEEFLLNTAREAVEICSRIQSPRLKIQLDTYHMNIEEDDMYQAIMTAASHLYSLHVSENNRRVPSDDGVIPWNSVAAAVRDSGFDGYVEMEPFLLTGGEIMYNSKIWRNNIDADDDESIDSKIQDGFCFVKKLFNTERNA